MFFPVNFVFLLLQIIISENLIQLDCPKLTQLLAAHYDCSEQNNLRRFRLTLVQKDTQAPSKLEYNRMFVSVFIRAKAKQINLVVDLQPFQTTNVSCSGCTKKYYKHDRMDWLTKYKLLFEKLNSINEKNFLKP